MWTICVATACRTAAAAAAALLLPLVLLVYIDSDPSLLMSSKCRARSRPQTTLRVQDHRKRCSGMPTPSTQSNFSTVVVACCLSSRQRKLLGKTLLDPKKDSKWERGRTRQALHFGAHVRGGKAIGAEVGPVSIHTDFAAPPEDRVLLRVSRAEDGQQQREMSVRP